MAAMSAVCRIEAEGLAADGEGRAGARPGGV